mmetsp:Transcript_14540/g.46406  ORF Transcript_14540/g.46406 Transcript_14540/m.46406 type:complete len:221 (+) Transcript_14540:588-1250(+)
MEEEERMECIRALGHDGPLTVCGDLNRCCLSRRGGGSLGSDAAEPTTQWGQRPGVQLGSQRGWPLKHRTATQSSHRHGMDQPVHNRKPRAPRQKRRVLPVRDWQRESFRPRQCRILEESTIAIDVRVDIGKRELYVAAQLAPQRRLKAWRARRGIRACRELTAQLQRTKDPNQEECGGVGRRIRSGAPSEAHARRFVVHFARLLARAGISLLALLRRALT